MTFAISRECICDWRHWFQSVWRRSGSIAESQLSAAACAISHCVSGVAWWVGMERAAKTGLMTGGA